MRDSTGLQLQCLVPDVVKALVGRSAHHTCTTLVCSTWQASPAALGPAAAGQVLVVSTHNKEMSEEVHSAKYLNSGVASMAVCAALNRAGGHDLLDKKVAWLCVQQGCVSCP